MSERKFFGGTMVIVDPSRHVLTSLWAIFQECGFDQILTYESVADLAPLVADTMIDLIVGDADMEEGGFVEQVREIRTGKDAVNPFVVAMALTNDPVESRVNALVNAGIDCVVVRPFSAADLLDRLDLMTHRRKDFVVTTSYIGPDRRVSARARPHLPLLSVPNSLKTRATYGYDEIKLRREIAVMSSKVDGQRKRQNAELIGSIVEQIHPLFEAGQADATILLHLKQLKQTADDMIDRLTQQERENVAALCATLSTLASRLAQTYCRPEPRDLDLLRELGSAIDLAMRDQSQEAKTADILSSLQQAKMLRPS